jgi:putative salt-induced outer membrane protein YdiY
MIRSFTFISFFLLSVIASAQETHTNSSKKISSHASAADILSSLEAPDTNTKIQKPPMLIASAELGFLYKTGNTHSGDFKTGVDLRFEKGSWLSLLNLDLLLKKSDIADADGDYHFKTTDQKWTLSSQTNYSLDNNEKNYIYGTIWFVENEFSGFENQASISSGWGRHWYKSQDSSLWGDIGPGYKRDLFKASETEPQRTADTFIVQAQALYIRKLGEHIEFKQYFSIKQALKTSENSIYKAETSVTTKLISTLQLKFTFTLDYNSKVETEKEKLDTQTAVTLVYSF